MISGFVRSLALNLAQYTFAVLDVVSKENLATVRHASVSAISSENINSAMKLFY